MAILLISLSSSSLVLLRLFTVGGLIIFLLCPTVSCLQAAPPSNGNNNYYCDWCPRHSTASPDDLDALLRGSNTDGGGACGYPAAEVDEAGAPHVAAAGADFFFRDGAGCGACYQLRCRDRRVCADGGVKVAVVAGAANRTTGFGLPREAFAAMARPGMFDQVANNAVDVDFRRIPCEYRNKNLSVRVEEGSARPGHLAIAFLYQGGQTDILAVEIAPAAAPWRSMARARGRGRRRGVVTWRTARAPAGPLRLRLVVTAGLGGKWQRAAGDAVLPADWRPGQVHDTGIRVEDVALSTCARSCRARRRPAAAGGGGEELR